MNVCIITMTVLFITKTTFDTQRDTDVPLIFRRAKRDIKKILLQYA